MLDIKKSGVNKTALSPFVAQAVEFTQAYKEHKDDHVAIREAMCLKAQYPAILRDLRPEDTIAGRRPEDIIVYFGTIWWHWYPEWRKGVETAGKQGGYCVNFSAAKNCAKNDAERKALKKVLDFWEDECSQSKIRKIWDDELKNSFLGGASTGFCMSMDFDRLLKRGVPGLIEDIIARKSQVKKKGGDEGFLDGLLIMLDVFKDTCLHYRRQAENLAKSAKSAKDRKRLEETARILEAITVRAPQSFREAVQLLWLYLLMGSGKHIEPGRLDIFLGDFYANDLDKGTITEEEAMELILSLWSVINENGEPAVSRVVLGGKGRRNEKNADRFAMAALEATRRFKNVKPQLTFRFYEGQDPKLFSKALDVVGENGVFPMFYNDDTNVPGASKSLGVSLEEAVRYHPLGCGEYMLAWCSPSLLDSAWSVPKSFLAALHDGKTCDGHKVGPGTGAVETFDTFEKLYSAFKKQIDYAMELSSRIYKGICVGHQKHNAFLFASLLSDDCLGRGRAMFDGGIRYLGGCEMGHGFTNAADSLTAIKKIVYGEKKLSLTELVKILDNNFEGREDVRKMLLNAPKFGNDDKEADGMLADMWKYINKSAKLAGKKRGLDFLVVSSVNPGGYGMGKDCGATADGRRKGEPFAIGMAPTAGFDKKGLTAMFNSVAKVDPAHGGATTNVKLSREFFTAERAKMEMLFKVYFKKGGMQANVTVVNKDDLQAALKEPEKYSHVMVRLGGWSARFIDLEPMIQEEIIRRTLY
ncbi:MAG TPA: hypothetical protein DET40_17120 [Lentisphaeria bacterium]|nr:MAG: hypothetical protein A2X45_02885 [Lentisphaerae bacterium GWF2_50_93]HCE45263.1 hypothetical protein [Lentisphaeria bacterium]